MMTDPAEDNIASSSSPETDAATEPSGDDLTADEQKHRAAPAQPGHTVAKEAFGAATALAAFLIYFGWVRTNEQASQLGIEASLLRLDSEDYILRSVRPAIVAIAVTTLILAALGQGLKWLDRRVESWRTDPNVPRFKARMTRWLGVMSLVAGLATFAKTFGASPSAVAPTLTAAGVLIAYTGHRTVLALRETPESIDPLTAAALVIAAILAGLGFTFLVARNVGQNLAGQVVAELNGSPSITLYSELDLGIDIPCTVLGTGAERDLLRYQYACPNLRLLFATDDAWFLVPHDWVPAAGSTYLVPIDERVRLDVKK
ncbi:MAG: hypothetical protein GY708_26420 [Actinomycetia bacterium]|nr:hypothetical protein [Actinomycetes bacterium]